MKEDAIKGDHKEKNMKKKIVIGVVSLIFALEGVVFSYLLATDQRITIEVGLKPRYIDVPAPYFEYLPPMQGHSAPVDTKQQKK